LLLLDPVLLDPVLLGHVPSRMDPCRPAGARGRARAQGVAGLQPAGSHRAPPGGGPPWQCLEPRELPHGVREAAPRCRPVLPRGRLARRRLFPRGGARRTGSCRGRARGGARRRRWSSTSRAAWTPRRAGRCSRCGTSCARRCTLSARWWQGAPRLRGNRRPRTPSARTSSGGLRKTVC
ncbi:unnamed protein product, partial [Prorocentrum cordatum]